MEEMLALLRSNVIFKSLNDAELGQFAKLARARSYRKGEFLCLYGDRWPYLFIVAQGSIAAQKDSSEGRSLLISTFAVGEVFWGLTLFDEQAGMPVTLEARQKSRIYLWVHKDCQPFFIQHGELSWEIARLMAQRMLLASGIVEGLAFQPVTQRLARLLIDQYPADQQAVARNLTLDEMAARIGSTREMVCRILYRFADQGAIQINRTEFVFKDRQLLEDYT